MRLLIGIQEVRKRFIRRSAGLSDQNQITVVLLTGIGSTESA
jgi:hypothetical protein